MKKYVIMMTGKNKKLNTTPRYLKGISHKYPDKTVELEEALGFKTKGEAQKMLKNIDKNNLYNTRIDIVKAEEIA